MSDEFRVGVASVDISPQRPELLWVRGLHRTESARGVLEGNRQWADAMAFEAGGRRAVVATADLGGVGRMGEAVRKAVAEKTGAEEQRIILAGRHNHSAGGRAVNEKDPDAARAEEQYWQGVREGITEACVKAVEALRPAEIAAGTAALRETVGQSRRMRYGHGGVMPSWGAGPVAIPGEKFAGPGPDSTEIDFLCAREHGAAQPFGILTSYASHIHLSSIPYFSGEVAGGIKNAIRRRLPGTTVVYAASTCGDLDMHSTHPSPAGGMEAEAQWFRESCRVLGGRFADALVPAIPADGYRRPAGLRHELYETVGHETDRRKRYFAVSAIGLGDVAVATVPSEMFLEHVNEIRRTSAVPHVLLVGFGSGGWLGYIGTPLAYEQGGYETSSGPAPSPEDEERLIAAGVKDWRRIGRARVDTGLEIVQRASAVLARLAR